MINIWRLISADKINNRRAKFTLEKLRGKFGSFLFFFKYIVDKPICVGCRSPPYQMSKEPKTVFLLSENGYIEISYEQFSKIYKSDNEYMKTHFFIRSQDELLEVVEKKYKEHYKQRRRQKYLKELSAQNNDVSYDALTTAEFNGEDIIVDREEDVADHVSNKIMLE